MDKQFIEELASAAPTPGGGAACAYVGVLATCLTSMVGNLTVGKERYRNVEEEACQKLVQLEGIRERLANLVRADEEAFAPLAAAYRMPRGTDEERALREAAVQEALYGASEVPLEVMETILEALGVAKFFAYNGNRSALSDIGAAATFARAAAHGVRMTVVANISSMKDEQRARIYKQRMDSLLADIDQQSEFVESYVLDYLS